MQTEHPPGVDRPHEHPPVVDRLHEVRDAVRDEASPVRGSGTAATTAAAALLQACGGGAGELPAAFSRSAEAPLRRQILGASAAAADGASGPVPTPTELMDWAEIHHADYFPGHQPDAFEAPYTYRLYAATGNAVGVADGMVYVLGPVVGSPSVPVAVGTLADFAPLVYARRYAYSDPQAARFVGAAVAAPFREHLEKR